MKVDNERIINLVHSSVNDLIFHELKSKFIVLNKEYALGNEESFKTVSYLDNNGNKINVFKMSSTIGIKSVKDKYVVIRKKHLYLTSNREIIVVDVTNKITPISEIIDLQEKTPYKKFEIDYVINNDESFIHYSKFDYSKYDLKENPIDLILECMDKRIDKLQKRIDRLNNIKKFDE